MPVVHVNDEGHDPASQWVQAPGRPIVCTRSLVIPDHGGAPKQGRSAAHFRQVHAHLPLFSHYHEKRLIQLCFFNRSPYRSPIEIDLGRSSMHDFLSGPNALAAYRMTAKERLAEVTTILARGLVRLHRHTAEDNARDAANAADLGENLLRNSAHRSGHANRTKRRLA